MSTITAQAEPFAQWHGPLGFLLTMKAEFKRSLIFMRRYPLATAGSFIISFIMIWGIFIAGAEVVGGGSLEAAADKVIGFLVWSFTMSTVGVLVSAAQGGAQTGVLEQICLSPTGIRTNFLARAVCSMIAQLFYVIVLLVALMLITPLSLHQNVPVWSCLLVLVMTLASLLGLGLIFSGLALMWKRIGQLTILVRIMLLLIVLPSYEQYGPTIAKAVKTFPMAHGVMLLRRLMVQGATLMEIIESGDMFILTANSAVWLLIGLSVFTLMETWSRVKGTLGIY